MSNIDKVREYWDGAAGKTVEDCNGSITLRLNYWKQPNIMKNLLKYDFFGKTVVEIGVGHGFIAGLIRLLHGGKINYLGTDISEKFCEVASSLFNLKTVVCDSNNLPKQDGEVDYIFAFDVLEHIHPKDRISVAHEFDRVLNRNTGMVFINSPLSETKHDPNFDFGIDDIELAAFAMSANLGLHSIDTWSTEIGLGKIWYKFIVLSRDSKTHGLTHGRTGK
jgi:ubiquinone/menaquinone biosynthesis C-methylase UbiE